MRLMAIVFKGSDAEHVQKVKDLLTPIPSVSLGFMYQNEEGLEVTTPVGFIDKDHQIVPLGFMTDPEFDPFFPKFISTNSELINAGFVDNSDQKQSFKFLPTYVPKPTRIVFADETGFTEIPYFVSGDGGYYNNLQFEEKLPLILNDLKFMSTTGESINLFFVDYLDRVTPVSFYPTNVDSLTLEN